MKSSLLKLPVEVDSFEKIRKDGFYYVDKTTLIEQLLEQWGEVNLFTRPRRFGKTLNMSMLRCFFEIGADRSLFDGLDISKNQELCNTYMGKFPVVFLSLKNVDGLTFADAKYRLTELVAAEAERFLFLSDSKKLSENEKSRYQALISLDQGRYTMDEAILVSSLQLLSQLLYKHYGQKTMILSNAESGDGFSDILIEPEDPDMGIVIELKYASDFSGLENACKKALQQIKDRRYADRLKNDGRSDILAYGIAFCKKRCRVIAEQL